ncbi:NADH-quinone oxidoreductase subunit L, partial [Tenacibaculum discolor]
MYFLVFHGKEHFHHKPFPGEHDHHDDDHGHGHGHAHTPHESPWVVWLPLVLLAVPSVFIGYKTIQPMLFGDFFKDAIFVNHELHPAMEELAHEFHSAAAMGMHAFTSLPFML